MIDLRPAEGLMPFRIYTAILSSQLFVTVADRVPEFDVGPFCRAYPTGTSLQDCLASEKRAHERLIEAWPRYTAQDKAMCVVEEKIAGLPSYVGWLTCLDINANARSVNASSGGASAPGAGAPGGTGPKRNVHRRRPGAASPLTVASCGPNDSWSGWLAEP
jgi:hypothetical protein